MKMAGRYRKNMLKTTLIMGLSWVFILAAAHCNLAAELFIPSANGLAGQIFTAPIKLDQVENLAGMKLVIKYDAKLLTYKAAAKSTIASSFLHVVNDKKPGELIIVMASAIGIKGSDITMISLDFAVNESLREKQTTRLEISEMQLMSDKLKELNYKITCHPIELSANPRPALITEDPQSPELKDDVQIKKSDS